MAKNKFFVFPGWFSRVKNYGLGQGAEIWQMAVNPTANFDAEYLLGHSLGANFALIAWRANRNAKLILVSPLIPKRSVLSWFWRWLGYVFSEGLIVSPGDILANRIWFALREGLKLLRKDFSEIIQEIPRENLLIIRGKDDKYFCDQAAADFFKKENIALIEVEGCGHNWSEKIKEAVFLATNR